MDLPSEILTQNNTLEHLGVDECCVVVGFSEELHPEQRQRLEELGFCPGAYLKCMKNTPFGGPRIFEVGGSVFSIEANLAKHLKVKCDHG